MLTEQRVQEINREYMRKLKVTDPEMYMAEWVDAYKESTTEEIYQELVAVGSYSGKELEHHMLGHVYTGDIIAYVCSEDERLGHRHNELAGSLIINVSESLQKDYQEFLKQCIEYLLSPEEAFKEHEANF